MPEKNLLSSYAPSTSQIHGSMTIVVVVLVGAGILLLASALDNTPIVSTFQKIIAGGSIDWSGSGKQRSPGPEGTKTAQCPQGDIYVLKANETQCPPGYSMSNGLPGTCICNYGAKA